MRIIYSFNKTDYEAECWEKEIRFASTEEFKFIPFNSAPYLDPNLYPNAWKLDQFYRAKHPGLMQMYSDVATKIHEYEADAILVTNALPYHPDFLKKLSIYRVMYSTDDPDATYRKNIPYQHGYHHVFYCSPSYSPEMDMKEKMHYCGMINADWLPLGVFDFEFDPIQTEETLFSKERDIDIIYVGSFFRQKLELLARVKRAFGRRLRMHGFFRWKHNLYFNVKFGYGVWIRPISFQQRVQMYQRAKIGFNIHWNDYGLGNQRLYHLPANGVMQICDCPTHLDRIFKVGEEVITYYSADDLIDKLRYYLEHDQERQAIAQRGYQRTMQHYRFGQITQHAGRLIQQGMERISWK